MANIQKTEVVTTMNNSQAVDKLKELRTEAAKYCDEMIKAKTAGDTISYNNMLKQLNQVNNEIRLMQRNAVNVNDVMSRLSTSKPREIQKAIKAINTELNSGRIERGSKEWDEYTSKLKRCKAELQSVNNELKTSGNGGNFFTKVADGFNRYSAAAAGAIAGFTGIAYTAKKCVDNFAEMDEAMTGVMKYTNMTKDQVKDLNVDLKKMDTRTPREQLNALAGDAGRLGITTKQGAEEFVDAADKINVALGEDLGPDAVKNIGRMAMMFGEDKTKGLRGAMLATGSAVNELSQEVGADANYLVGFTARLAGVAKQANMTQADVLGFAGVLNKNMIEEEVAGSALEQLLLKLYQQPQKFAKIAGLDVKNFTELLKTDANKALITFFESLKKYGNLNNLAPAFKDMGLDGVRASGVLSTLANKISDVRKQQLITNKAYQEGTSVITEFNTENNTVQAGFEKAGKRVKDLSIELGEKLQPIMTSLLHTTSLVISIMNTTIGFITKHIVAISGVTIALSTYLLVKKSQVMWAKLVELWEIKEWVAAMLLNRGYKLLYATISANPFAILIALTTAAAYANIKLTGSARNVATGAEEMNNKLKKSEEHYNNLNSVLKKYLPIAQDAKKSITERKNAINILQKVMPNYFKNLDIETAKNYNLADATSAVTRQLGIKIGMQKLSAQQDYNYLKGVMDKYNQELNDVSTIKGKEWYAGYQASKMAFDRAKGALDEANKANDKIVSLMAQQRREQNKASSRQNEKGNGETNYTSQTKTKKKKGKSAETLEREREKKAIDQIEAKYDKLKAVQTSFYASGQIDKQKFDDQINELDLEMLDKKMGVYKTDSKEYNALLLEKANKKKEIEDKAHAKSVEDVDQEAKKTRDSYLQMLIEKETDQKAFEEDIHQLEYDTLQKKRDVYAKGSKEYEDYQKQMDEWLYNDKLQKEKEFDTKLSEIKKHYAKMSDTEVMDEELKVIDEAYKRKLLSEEVYQQLRKAIQRKYAKDIDHKDFAFGDKSVKQSTRDDAQDLLNDSAAETPQKKGLLDNLFLNDAKIHATAMGKIKDQESQGIITHQKATEEKADIDSQYYDALAEKAQTAAQTLQGITSVVSEYNNACRDVEVAKVEKNYSKQIKAAGESTTKGKALEEKKEKEVAKIKSKYNKRTTQIQIAQALAETAVAALNAYAAGSKYGPVVAGIFAGIATASGMLQVATIKKQAAAQDEGYYSGGFTDGNNYHKVAGSVHEGEFVANHQAVNNPNVLPVLQLIDRAQRNNTIGTLTANDVIHAISRGSSADDPSSSSDNNAVAGIAVMSASLDKQSAIISRLSSLLETGIQSYVVMDGEQGLDKKYTHYKKLQSNKER